MTLEELRSELPNTTALLSALAVLLPGRVDPELIEHLEKVIVGGVSLELLHAALSRCTNKPAAAKTLKFG